MILLLIIFQKVISMGKKWLYLWCDFTILIKFKHLFMIIVILKCRLQGCTM